MNIEETKEPEFEEIIKVVRESSDQELLRSSEQKFKEEML